MYFSFFFSSRRRHTRLQGDWSSDVCSSDLPYCPPSVIAEGGNCFGGGSGGSSSGTGGASSTGGSSASGGSTASGEIGRASCRERVYIWVVGVAMMNDKDRGRVRRSEIQDNE